MQQLNLWLAPPVRADRDLRAAHGLQVAAASGTQLPDAERASGWPGRACRFVDIEPVRVVDEDMRDVPADGETIGRGGDARQQRDEGLLPRSEATADAFRGGWFHSGDMGVMHPDGYLELRDRAKDIIISGGENISTIEVEQAVAAHPAVLECAVVAMPDERWGSGPRRLSRTRPGEHVTEDELIALLPRAARPLQMSLGGRGEARRTRREDRRGRRRRDGKKEE